MRNELLLTDTLTLHYEDEGATLRVCLLWDDMVKITVHQPKSDEYKDFHILLSPTQMESIVELWNEWRDK